MSFNQFQSENAVQIERWRGAAKMGLREGIQPCLRVIRSRPGFRVAQQIEHVAAQPIAIPDAKMAKFLKAEEDAFEMKGLQNSIQSGKRRRHAVIESVFKTGQ